MHKTTREKKVQPQKCKNNESNVSSVLPQTRDIVQITPAPVKLLGIESNQNAFQFNSNKKQIKNKNETNTSQTHSTAQFCPEHMVLCKSRQPRSNQNVCCQVKYETEIKQIRNKYEYTRFQNCTYAKICATVL